MAVTIASVRPLRREELKLRLERRRSEKRRRILGAEGGGIGVPAYACTTRPRRGDRQRELGPSVRDRSGPACGGLDFPDVRTERGPIARARRKTAQIHRDVPEDAREISGDICQWLPRCDLIGLAGAPGGRSRPEGWRPGALPGGVHPGQRQPGFGAFNSTMSNPQAGSLRQGGDRFVDNLLPVIREVEMAGACSLGEIAAALNARGFRTRRGRSWTRATVRNLLLRGSQ